MMSESWLDRLVYQHRQLESPRSFWYWSALAAISAVVKDSVWINRQIYNLYPNIYVMLHADSGLKKGPPVSMAKQMVAKVGNTRVFSGRSSIQGILKDLGTAYSQPGGPPVLTSVGFICSNELSSSLVGDKVATDILTDLYDRQYNMGAWKSLLKMESFSLKNPTLTMLTATNEAHSKDFFEMKDVSGGFFARTFIITETERNQSNSLIVPMRNAPDYTELAKYLKELAKLKGAFEPMGSFTEDNGHEIKGVDKETGETVYFTQAGYRYHTWYEDFCDTVTRQNIRDDTGTLNRFGDSVLKVAMLLSLARAPTLCIDELSMNQAIEHCKRLVGNIREVTYGKRGLSDAKDFKSAILDEIHRSPDHQINVKKLKNNLWMHHASMDEFHQILNSLDEAGMVALDNVGPGQLKARMTDAEIERRRIHFTGEDLG